MTAFVAAQLLLIHVPLPLSAVFSSLPLPYLPPAFTKPDMPCTVCCVARCLLCAMPTFYPSAFPLTACLTNWHFRLLSYSAAALHLYPLFTHLPSLCAGMGQGMEGLTCSVSASLTVAFFFLFLSYPAPSPALFPQPFRALGGHRQL